jgi:hypothetical protein
MWVGSRLTTALYALVQIRQALYFFNINLIDKKELSPSKCHYMGRLSLKTEKGLPNQRFPHLTYVSIIRARCYYQIPGEDARIEGLS